MSDSRSTHRRGRFGRVSKMAWALILAAPATAFAADVTANPGAGNWSTGATWDSGSAPADGDTVIIPSGATVTFDHVMSSSVSFPLLRVEQGGTLKFATDRHTGMRVETLLIHGGTLSCGTTASPLPSNFKMDIVITNNGGQPVAPGTAPLHGEMGRGLISMGGSVQLFGTPKTKAAVLAADALRNTSTLSLVGGAPSNWTVGDSIVVAPTDFTRTGPLRDDRRTITSLNPVTLSAPLTFDHLRIPNANGQSYSTLFNVHVVNLTRNITISSEVQPLTTHLVPTGSPPSVPTFPETWPSRPSTSGPNYPSVRQDVRLRGHVMFMPMAPSEHWHGGGDRRGSAKLINVAFVRLGRTDKTVIVNDVDGGNRRGRYSVHFHHLGPRPGDNKFVGPDDEEHWDPTKTPTFEVTGCVVDESPGWGFVNHSSRVNFTNNIAYDYDGAGFMTEAGDEIGAFTGNIAIRGHGEGQIRKLRIARNNRLRFVDRFFDVSDFGFGGDGFWFQGPGCTFTQNVAAGNRGHGVIFHDNGLVEPVDGNPTLVLPNDPDEKSGGRYIGFPRLVFHDLYANFPDIGEIKPRRWSQDHREGFTDPYVVADLPLLQVSDFEGYANLNGFMMRWCNANMDFPSPYTDLPYADNMTAVNNPKRIRQAASDLKLWNNESGLSARYTEKTTFENVRIVNRLTHDRPGFADGIKARKAAGLNGSAFAPQPGKWENSLSGDNNDWPFYGILLMQPTAKKIILSGLVVDGYPVAVWLRDHKNNNEDQVTFPGTTSYFGYLELKNMLAENLRDAVSNLNPTTTPSSPGAVTLNWPSIAQAKFLVRFRVKPTHPNETRYWSYSTALTTNSFTTPGLPSGVQVEMQVMSSKNGVLSPWSASAVRTAP